MSDNTKIDLPQLRTWLNGDVWRKDAACLKSSIATDDFFPDRESPNIMAVKISRARLTCVTCTVRTDCLKFALANGITHGMYGGKSPKERRGMSVDTADSRIPLKVILDNLRRLRKAETPVRKTSLASDLAVLLKVSERTAQKMMSDGPDQYV